MGNDKRDSVTSARHMGALRRDLGGHSGHLGAFATNLDDYSLEHVQESV